MFSVYTQIFNCLVFGLNRNLKFFPLFIIFTHTKVIGPSFTVTPCTSDLHACTIHGCNCMSTGKIESLQARLHYTYCTVQYVNVLKVGKVIV